MIRAPSERRRHAPATIRWARPSTIAVLPTPAGPEQHGVALRVCRTRTSMSQAVSSSRPMTGRAGPRRASSVRSRPIWSSSGVAGPRRRWTGSAATARLQPARGLTGCVARRRHRRRADGSTRATVAADGRRDGRRGVPIAGDRATPAGRGRRDGRRQLRRGSAAASRARGRGRAARGPAEPVAGGAGRSSGGPDRDVGPRLGLGDARSRSAAAVASTAAGAAAGSAAGAGRRRGRLAVGAASPDLERADAEPLGQEPAVGEQLVRVVAGDVVGDLGAACGPSGRAARAGRRAASGRRRSRRARPYSRGHPPGTS